MRTLSLRKDTLVELASDELAQVAGAAVPLITTPCIRPPAETGLQCLSLEVPRCIA